MVEQITLKVEFKYPQRLNIGEIYTLWHKSDPNQSITFEYLAKSRIDGKDLFRCTYLIGNYSIMDFELHRSPIVSASFVNQVSDNLTDFKYKGCLDDKVVRKNKDELFKLFLDSYGVDFNDFYFDDKFKILKRDIKIKLITGN